MVAYASQEGHDVVVGGHLRTDKQYRKQGFNTQVVRFVGARQRLLRGGGNVWQHVRTFRKHLFDAVKDEDMREPCVSGVSC